VAVKPMGQPTRGFTAPNRLRLVDTYVLVALREKVRTLPGLFVDLGYGQRPITTVESFRRFRAVNPALRALGVEIVPERVAAAEPYRADGLEFRPGGFNLPLKEGEQAALVRAFNVLRQYEEAEVREYLRPLANSMPPGGVLVEGTSDPLGRHLCFWVWERTPLGTPLHRSNSELPLERRWLVFGARLHAGFGPRDLQPFLPKELIHRAEPGGSLDAFFATWDKGWEQRREVSLQERWKAAGQQVRAAGYELDVRPGLLSRGLLAVKAKGFANLQ